MWRALEKTGLRADLNLRWRADHICDIIRCMLVYETMQGMRDGLQEIVSRNQKDGQYVVGRVKDRLSQPNGEFKLFSASVLVSIRTSHRATLASKLEVGATS